ncbi:GIY-YIG nuclease family protein [Flavobacteriaceae bacterium F89]|uniref:GIY-YIG nuclease family protein n=1 Tax=Cerina litoralis TaxID=2874477 RepID=A0AAE3EZD8_9FLAO|nr:GIY-YIG nuclease family protein [Cerina litoralis]MCG2462984.1 GIY-YIG nuclease family protein [Cerina litoralis]
MFQVGYHTYYVYIITNKSKSVLYTGVTNYLAKRLFQHSENIRLKKKTFASRYNCSYLLYYEKYTWIQEAIAREKAIKGWSRQKKIELIKAINPNMDFLEHLFPYDKDGGY